MNYNYYVATISDKNEVRFVTKVDNATKTWFASKGEKAKVFKKGVADDLMFGMVINGVTAVVIKAPGYTEYSNPKE